MNCVFVADIHGWSERYFKLFNLIEEDRPGAVFIGGDVLPFGAIMKNETRSIPDDFVNEFLAKRFVDMKTKLAGEYPRIFIIMGNDDARIHEEDFIRWEESGIWEYMHGRKASLGKYTVYGYSCIPPSPFRLKDWERYDVSRFVDPGCIPPEEGIRTMDIPERDIKNGTIKTDLEKLAGEDNLDKAILLFHCPPYKTGLDRAALDGKTVDHTPVDVHIGSIAIQRFMESRQPFLGLHGHVHESARITGSWRDKIGNTSIFSAAHDGNELAVIRFDPDDLAHASRELI